MLRADTWVTLYDHSMEGAADRAAHSAGELGRRLGIDHHDVLLLLGSGLSRTAEVVGAGGTSVPLDTLPFFPPYTAGGHRAHAWSVQHGGLRLLIMGGRCHLYEGRTAAEVVHPLRTGIAAGCRTVILTAAVGGIRDDLITGSIVMVEDHLNLTGCSPVTGPDFVDMIGAYPARLRGFALATAEPAAAVLSPRPAVYAQVRGPQFETPAEIRMLRAAGADVVGMSMALETIAARQAGADVLGLAVVTNAGASVDANIDIAEIVDVGTAAVPAVAAIVHHVVGSLP